MTSRHTSWRIMASSSGSRDVASGSVSVISPSALRGPGTDSAWCLLDEGTSALIVLGTIHNCRLLQATFSNKFSCNRWIWFKFHCSLFAFYFILSVQLQKVRIGSDNGLAPNRRQVISWSNVDLIHWRIYMRRSGSMGYLGEHQYPAWYLFHSIEPPNYSFFPAKFSKRLSMITCPQILSPFWTS